MPAAVERPEQVFRGLAQVGRVAPPDAAECRRICEDKIAAADFAIGLAETPWWRLPLRLPASAALSLARRDPRYLRETAKYLLGPLYVRHRDRATARRRTDVAA